MGKNEAVEYLKYLHKKEAECRGDLLRLEEAKMWAECRAKFLETFRGSICAKMK